IKAYPLSFKNVEFIKTDNNIKTYLTVTENPGTITIEQRKSSGGGGTSGDGMKYVDKDDQKPDDQKPDDQKPDDKVGAEKFVDLEGFDWAYESIDALVKAGIV